MAQKVNLVRENLKEFKQIMISPMEMNQTEGVKYLKEFIDKVNTIQFDGSDRYTLSKRWLPMTSWVKILYDIDSTKKYYLHMFSNNFDWIKNQLSSCLELNTNLEGIFIQVDKSNIKKITEIIEQINILSIEFSKYNLKLGISINLTDIIYNENPNLFLNKISELSKDYFNQITLPLKRTIGEDTRWIEKTANNLSPILEFLNSGTKNKWGIDRGVDKFILLALLKRKRNSNLPGVVTLGRGLIYF